MTSDQNKRLKWIKLYEKYGNFGLVCLKCGISRPTLRKWLKRYKEQGLEGLLDQDKTPHRSPLTKVDKRVEEILLSYREKRKLGARHIQVEMQRNDQIKLSLATIHKVLKRNSCAPVSIRRIKKKTFKIYNRPIPGDRVQLDTCKIAPGIYQYTAIDDCSRYQVIDIYPRRTSANTLKFIDKVIEETPFPIQRIQTDRGNEFFAVKVQEKLMEYCIKFRPNKPRSPHLNGKVEGVQKTDLQEFYATQDLKNPNLREELGYWQHFYNWDRPHSSLKGKTPIDVISELSNKTPFSDEVEDLYDSLQERIQIQDYQMDLRLKELQNKC